jgi:CheY-like chemotaxis protein
VNQNIVKTSNHSSKIILLGEDDIDDQEFLKEVLASFNNSYFLNFENNGRKVVTHLETLADDSLPCLIILDFNLPELNAEEILTILNAHKRYNSIPKIVWSTSNSAIYKSKCIKLGASDYLVKPRDVVSFVETAKYMFSFAALHKPN